MKIIVSRFWRLEMWSTVGIEFLGILFSLICWHGDDIVLGLLMAGYCFFTMSFCQILGFVVQHRFLSHVIYENGTYTSFFWQKKLCVIHENDSVFYAKIHARISTFHYADFVLISTDSFEYHDVPPIRWFPWDPKPIQVSYDVKKMILLPYEENAPYLSKISQWTRIYPRPNI